MLKIEDLNVHYGPIYALKGISLDAEDKGLLAIIGANGAGKSTLLKTIVGLLKPSKGSIKFCGNEIANLPSHSVVKLGICLVPEGRQLFPNMTIMENLEMGAINLSDKKQFNKNLEIVYSHFKILKERPNQNAGTLSGGEQQMLAIGRGLMSNPKLLLLDEPSLGLAPIIVEQIIEIIVRLHRSGLTILLVEQNAQMALEIAERGCVLETGNLVMQGDSKELLNSEAVKKAYLGAGVED